MVSTEMTGVVKGFGSGLESHGRALGATVRDLLATFGSGKRLFDPVVRVEPETLDVGAVHGDCEAAIVDRTLTRC